MRFLALAILFAGLFSCSQKESNILELPEYVQVFAIPEDNKLTVDKIELGRKLFYEKGLSLDSSVSCASCHIQTFAFADTARVSRGFRGDTGFRNSSSLTNVAFQTAFFKDGGVKTLERAVHPPVLSEFEMNMNVIEMKERLNNNPVYPSMFKVTFGREIDHKGIVDALASFQRTFNSFNSPYDRHLQGDESALTESQKRGLALFRSERLNCTTCHIEPLFIDNKIHNIGLYEFYPDYGRGRVTLDSADYGKFRTPTLRNIAVTYPYLHDGSLPTLDAVLLLYQQGGVSHPNKSELIIPFTLSEAERSDLISFLHALTDSTFLNNPAFSNPNPAQ